MPTIPVTSAMISPQTQQRYGQSHPFSFGAHFVEQPTDRHSPSAKDDHEIECLRCAQVCRARKLVVVLGMEDYSGFLPE